MSVLLTDNMLLGYEHFETQKFLDMLKDENLPIFTKNREILRIFQKGQL